MPFANVKVPHAEFVQRCKKHDAIVAEIPNAAPHVQRLLAELVIMRLFDEFQEFLRGTALRLACGAPYVDGLSPTLLIAPCTSTTAAETTMLTLNRQTPWRYLQFSNSAYVRKSTKHVLGAGDPFLQVLGNNSAIFEEMRRVRNRIAHNSFNTRTNFSLVVQGYYGAKLNGISPGLLLLSPRLNPRPIDLYLGSCRAIAKGCVRAQ